MYLRKIKLLPQKENVCGGRNRRDEVILCVNAKFCVKMIHIYTTMSKIKTDARDMMQRVEIIVVTKYL
jgi:hypothetical protein